MDHPVTLQVGAQEAEGEAADEVEVHPHRRVPQDGKAEPHQEGLAGLPSLRCNSINILLIQATMRQILGQHLKKVQRL